MGKPRIALIPAFDPDQCLLMVLEEMNEKGFTIVVVNDGSSRESENLFRKADEYTVVHECNNNSDDCGCKHNACDNGDCNSDGFNNDGCSDDGCKNRRRIEKTAFAYLLISLFLALFGAVYEMFSHGVYSYYMLYAFAIPLTGGALPFLALALFARHFPGRNSARLYHSGIAALTVGCIVQGALKIYGTSNRLIVVYWIAGGILLLVGIGSYCLRDLSANRTMLLTKSSDSAMLILEINRKEAFICLSLPQN